MLEGTSGTIACGGDRDESSLYFSPTIVTDVTGDDKLMLVSFLLGWVLKDSTLRMSSIKAVNYMLCKNLKTQ